jgi:hypothetical protein
VSLSAVNSALGGLGSARDRYSRSAAAVSEAGLPESRGDLVGAVGESHLAAQAVKINAASLHAALDTERALIDLFA